MSAKHATPEDIANVCKLLERLRTGELNLIPSLALDERKQDASTELLQRVESVLADHLRRMQAPMGDGGPAFPVVFEHSDGQAVSEHFGMDLRDYFAAKALSGLVVNGENFDINRLTAYSYEMADAMLRARKTA